MSTFEPQNQCMQSSPLACAVRHTVIANNVASVPTFVGFKGGQAVGTFSGADRDALVRLIGKLEA